MRQEPFYFLVNNLFSLHTIKEEFPKLYSFTDDIAPIFNDIKSLYDKESFKKKYEHQFEDDFISKVLVALGWNLIRQEIKIIQGKQDKPDFTLFISDEDKNLYEALPQNERYYTNKFISVLCESKAYDIEIDNKRIKDNPHFQIINYLNSLKITHGFLTNGRKWRYYDSGKFSSQKVFYEIDLEAIIENSDIEAFKYFYYVFRKQNFELENSQSTAMQIREKDEAAKISIEENLKSVIYGYDNQTSIFQTVGNAIYKNNNFANIEEIYENSVYFIFRVLFIVYFEDKYEDTLNKHTHYKNFSLNAIYNFLQDADGSHFTGYRKLKELFEILDHGDDDVDIPLFNGGLFDLHKAPLLNAKKLIDNKTLLFILDSLFYFQKDGKSLFKRDFKTLSIAHIGKIYEGILSFRFEVAEENTYYLEYTDKKSKTATKFIDGFFDEYDYGQIAKNYKIAKQESYQKNDLILKNASNSRKTTASYYTPQSLSGFLVKEAIESALSSKKNLLDLKILDNSCGSGHFLVEALDFIASKALDLYENSSGIKEIVASEKEKIEQSVAKYISGAQIDEMDVLKRILLKKLIFGVDLNPFAVELTRLSLWMDSFIFGTPLSFIEHHIKCGNALIGSQIKEFLALFGKGDGKTLFNSNFATEFEELSKVYERLDNLKDTTTLEIEESKAIYKNEIVPKLQKLNTALNVVTLLEFKKHEKQNATLFANIKAEVGIAEQIFDEQNVSLIKEITKYAKEYSFFNYEIEFPEVFCHKDTLFNEQNGFDIIIGNPPWDKTKFSDTDFFPQFVSNYRTLIDSKKKETKDNLLFKNHIKAKYEKEQDYTYKVNVYYKNGYPLNKGSGDGNLFRFFVEKNLSLLNQNGTLNYVLPSALMFEEGSTNLRKEIFEKYNLNIFYSFENNDAIFDDIHRSYKFALMQIENSLPKNTPIKTMFYKTNTESLQNQDEIIEYDLNTLKILSPNYLSLMELRRSSDLDIVKKCYAKYAPLSEEWLDFRRELDMTNDKSIFIEERRDGLLPLYEGKMIWQYHSNFEKPKYYLDKTVFDSHIIDTEARRIVSDIYPALKTDATPQIRAVLEYFGLAYNGKDSAKNLKQLHQFVKFDREFFRLGFREVSSDTNERTLVFSMLPKDCGFGHTLFANCSKTYIIENNTIAIKQISTVRLLFAQAVFDSIIVDFLVRQMVQIHVSKTYLMRLPLPQLSDDEILQNYKQLVINSLMLTLSNDFESFEELAREFGIAKNDLPKTQKQIDMLKIQNDCIVAKMYDISKDELEYILSTFKVLNNKKPEYVNALIEAYNEGKK